MERARGAIGTRVTEREAFFSSVDALVASSFFRVATVIHRGDFYTNFIGNSFGRDVVTRFLNFRCRTLTRRLILGTVSCVRCDATLGEEFYGSRQFVQ